MSWTCGRTLCCLAALMPSSGMVKRNDLQDFINYLLKTWIGPIHARSGQRRYPMFRHELWNKMEAVLNDEDTTTNCSEGFNNAIQLSIPHNANVFSVIKQFKAEDALMMVKLREGATTALLLSQKVEVLATARLPTGSTGRSLSRPCCRTTTTSLRRSTWVT